MTRAVRIDNIAAWALRWALLFGLWLVLTDTRRAQELIVGAVAAAIAATVASTVTRPGRSRPANTIRSLARLGPRLLRLPVRLVLDTGLITVALWRHLFARGPLSGTFRRVRYHPGQDRRSPTGRALTELWGSLAANRFVIGADEQDATLLVHELVPSDRPLDPLARR